MGSRNAAGNMSTFQARSSQSVAVKAAASGPPVSRLPVEISVVTRRCKKIATMVVATVPPMPFISLRLKRGSIDPKGETR